MRETLLSQIGSVIAAHRWRYAWALFAIVMSNVLLIANPLLLRRAVAGGSFWIWGFVLLTVTTLSALFRYLMRVAFIAISRDAEMELRDRLFDHIQHQDQGFFDRHRVGDLMSRLVNDIAIYRDMMGPGIMYPAFFSTLVIPAVIALFVIEARLAWIALIPIVVLLFLMTAIRSILFRTGREVQRSLGEMSAMAQETYSGIRLVKGYAEERPFAHRFRALCRNFFRHSLKLQIVENLFYPAIGLVGKWTTVLLVMSAGVLLVGGSADFVSFMWVQGYLLVPVLLLGWILPLYQRGRGAYERIVEVYEEPLMLTDGKGEAVGSKPTIELVDCYFSYDGNPVLKGISATLSGLTGITGPPGGGKTTLLRLLNRDYPFAEGMISIDGIPIEHYALDDIRKKIAVVEQEPFLFSRTLGENIALARPGAPVDAVIRQAQLVDTVAQLPKGLETVVGERGVTLSGGQKQRVALARALLTDAPILLLDDVFSALDAATARAIFSELKQLDRTVILVTHSIEFLEQVDNLLYLDSGELVEVGPPSQHRGPFAKMRSL